MIGAWVLIVIQLSGGIIGSPAVNVQAIYFQTKAACDAVALVFNGGGPEPSPDVPKDKQKSFGAICRATGAP